MPSSKSIFTAQNIELTDNGMPTDISSPSPSTSSLDGLGEFFEGLDTTSPPAREATPRPPEPTVPSFIPSKPNPTLPRSENTENAALDKTLFPLAQQIDDIEAALGPGPHDEDTALILSAVSGARCLMSLARRLVGDTETLLQANIAIGHAYELYQRSEYATGSTGRKRKRAGDFTVDGHDFYEFRPVQTPTGSEMLVDDELDDEQPADSDDESDAPSNRIVVYLDHMDTTKGQDPSQVSAWEKMDQAVLVRVYGVVPSSGDEAILACRAIEAAVRTAIPLHSKDLVVSPPTRDDAVRNPSIRPAYFLVILGCHEDFWALSSLSYICNQHASLIIVGSPPIGSHSFIAAATELTLTSSKKHVAILKDAIVEAIVGTPAGARYKEFWRRHKIGSMVHIDSRDCVQVILANMTISPAVVGMKLGQSKTVFSIHIPPFTNNPILHYEWRRLFADLQVDTILYGRSKLMLRPYFCEGCHGVDHPRGLCPFLAVPNWKADSGFGGMGGGPRGPKPRV